MVVSRSIRGPHLITGALVALMVISVVSIEQEDAVEDLISFVGVEAGQIDAALEGKSQIPNTKTGFYLTGWLSEQDGPTWYLNHSQSMQRFLTSCFAIWLKNLQCPMHHIARLHAATVIISLALTQINPVLTTNWTDKDCRSFSYKQETETRGLCVWSLMSMQYRVGWSFHSKTRELDAFGVWHHTDKFRSFPGLMFQEPGYTIHRDTSEVQCQKLCIEGIRPLIIE